MGKASEIQLDSSAKVTWEVTISDGVLARHPWAQL